MTKYLLLILPILYGLASHSFANSNERLVQVVYVADVQLDMDQSISNFLTTRIKEEFSKSSKVKIANFSNTQDGSIASCIASDDCARKEARAVDADQVLITNIVKTDRLCQVDMRLESIYSKEILRSNHLKSSCNQADLSDKAIDLTYYMMEHNQILRGEREAIINSEPSGAKVVINNSYIGKTPLKTRLPLGRAKVWMEIPNDSKYTPFFGNEFIEENSLAFQYNKNFIEQKAYLVFNVQPEKINITINGKNMEIESGQKIPVNIRESLKLTLNAGNYNSENRTISGLEPDQEFQVNVNLNARPCLFILTSEPSGADVIIGGEKFGTTPFEKEIPGMQDYEVFVEKEFHNRDKLTLQCMPDEKIVEKSYLTKARSGYLNVRAINKLGESIQADIELNYRKTGQTTPETLEIDADRKNRIELSHPDYLVEKFDVVVSGNETIERTELLTYKKETYWRILFRLGIEGQSLKGINWRYIPSDSNDGIVKGSNSVENTNLALALEREIIDFFSIKLITSVFNDTAGKDEKVLDGEVLGKPNTLTNSAMSLNGYSLAIATPIYLIKLDPLTPARCFGFYVAPELGHSSSEIEFKSGYDYKFSQKFSGIALGLDWHYKDDWKEAKVANFEIGIRQFADIKDVNPNGDEEFLPTKGNTFLHFTASWGWDF